MTEKNLLDTSSELLHTRICECRKNTEKNYLIDGNDLDLIVMENPRESNLITFFTAE